jgi:signal transduction histidine kinase
MLLPALEEMLRLTLGAAIKVELRLAEGLPKLLADRGQLETVLVNLATNARDAMPDGGVLTFAAGAASSHSMPSDLQPGSYVQITVADTGIGMDMATAARATEPFFSTKPSG